MMDVSQAIAFHMLIAFMLFIIMLGQGKANEGQMQPQLPSESFGASLMSKTPHDDSYRENLETINRPTSVVTNEQRQQFSGYDRMRMQHRKEIQQLEMRFKQERDRLDKELNQCVQANDLDKLLRNSTDLLLRNSTDLLLRNSTDLLLRNSTDQLLRNSTDLLLRNSTDLMKKKLDNTSKQIQSEQMEKQFNNNSIKAKKKKIERQYTELCKTQMRQFKALKQQMLETVPREKHKEYIIKMKREVMKKMAILGKQYEQDLKEIEIPVSTSLNQSHEYKCNELQERLRQEMDLLQAYQNKSRLQLETHHKEMEELEECVSIKCWEFQNPQVPVAIIPLLRPRRERDVGPNNQNGCYPDEYWSNVYRHCKPCTRCSPGTQHDPAQPCGYGQGQEAHCIPCEDGLYQSQEGIAVLTCRLCLECDPQAVVKSVCTRRKNTVCGKCQEGWHYGEPNVCVECTEADMADVTNQDCYKEPDPTPGPEPSPGPVLDPQPPQPKSTIAPPVDRSTSGRVLKPTSGAVVNPQPQKQLDHLEIALIVGSIVAAAISLVAVLIIVVLKRRKPKKENVPPQDEQEMQNLCEEYKLDDRKPPGSLQPLVQPHSTVPTESRSKEASLNDSTLKDSHSDKPVDGNPPSLANNGSSKTLRANDYSEEPNTSHLGLPSKPGSLKSNITTNSHTRRPNSDRSNAAADDKKDVRLYDIHSDSVIETASGFGNSCESGPLSGYGDLTSDDRPPWR